MIHTRRRCLPAALALLACCLAARLRAQTPGIAPAPGSAQPPVVFEGLIPGVSTMEDAKKKLGAPAHEGSWYAWKMIWPSKRRPDLFDAIHIQGKRLIGDIETVTVPAGCETWAAVKAKLGEPEFLLELSRQSMADYSAKGVRFTFDEKGSTIGAAFFPHGYPRVHSGGRHHVSLKGLRQGPQPRPAATLEASGPPLLCGAAQADITPEGADWLGPTQYVVHDRLRARAAVFAQGDLKIAIVGGDIFGMLKLDVDPIEADLRKDGITHLLLALSHVHSAGDPIGIYGHYPKEFVKHIQDGVARAVKDALAGLKPVKELRAASDELPLDGARVVGLFRNARNPGILDPQVAALQAVGADGKPIVTIAHFACHPEGIEKPKDKPLEVSADFPGYMCDALGASTGAQAVFLNGAVGGMVSGDSKARTHDEAKGMGERLAKEIERVLGFAIPLARKLEVDRRRVEIPVTNPKMIAFEMAMGRPASYRGRHVTEMFHVRLGDAQLLSVPGELLPEVSFEVLERMKGYPRMIVGLGNDEIGYIIPPYDFRAGEYEESMSLGPASAPVVLDEAWRMLDGRE